MAAERLSRSVELAGEVVCVAVSALLCVAALRASPSSAHFVGVQGRVEDAGSSGLGYRDAVFLAGFRRPIADPAILERPDRGDALRRRLLADFEADRAALEPRMPGASERELLLAYLTLRVNGSAPIFDPTSSISDDLTRAVTSTSGNCATLGMRLMLVLELFGVDAKLVHWWSPAMEGHVFVDAFDPREQRAYFLDPTSNIVIGLATDGRGLLDALEPLSPEVRRASIERGLTVFPQCFSLVENAPLDFDEWSQANRLRAVDSAVSGLTFDLPIAARKWAAGEQAAPARLRELSEMYPTLGHAFAVSDETLSAETLSGEP
jgi:hypothetical protein